MSLGPPVDNNGIYLRIGAAASVATALVRGHVGDLATISISREDANVHCLLSMCAIVMQQRHAHTHTQTCLHTHACACCCVCM